MEPRNENSKIKSIREDSNSQDDNYQDEYSQIIQNELKNKIIIRNSLKKKMKRVWKQKLRRMQQILEWDQQVAKAKIDITKKTEYRLHLIE